MREEHFHGDAGHLLFQDLSNSHQTFKSEARQKHQRLDGITPHFVTSFCDEMWSIGSNLVADLSSNFAHGECGRVYVNIGVAALYGAHSPGEIPCHNTLSRDG